MSPKSKAKKSFVKPEVTKHKAIAVIAGSGKNNDCIYSANISDCHCYYY